MSTDGKWNSDGPEFFGAVLYGIGIVLWLIGTAIEVACIVSSWFSQRHGLHESRWDTAAVAVSSGLTAYGAGTIPANVPTSPPVDMHDFFSYLAFWLACIGIFLASCVLGALWRHAVASEENDRKSTGDEEPDSKNTTM